MTALFSALCILHNFSSPPPHIRHKLAIKKKTKPKSCPKPQPRAGDAQPVLGGAARPSRPGAPGEKEIKPKAARSEAPRPLRAVGSNSTNNSGFHRKGLLGKKAHKYVPLFYPSLLSKSHGNGHRSALRGEETHGDASPTKIFTLSPRVGERQQPLEPLPAPQAASWSLPTTTGVGFVFKL